MEGTKAFRQMVVQQPNETKKPTGIRVEPARPACRTKCPAIPTFVWLGRAISAVSAE